MTNLAALFACLVFAVLNPSVGSSTVEPRSYKSETVGSIPAPPTTSLTNEELVGEAIEEFFPESEWATALCVAQHESGFNRWAVGVADERGIMQLWPGHIERIQRLGYSLQNMYEIRPNVEVAADLWRDQGWAPWMAWWRYCR